MGPGGPVTMTRNRAELFRVAKQGAGVAGELTASERRWLDVRADLREHRFELGRKAVEGAPDAVTVGSTPLLSTSHWLPADPIPLREIELEFRPDAPYAGLTGTEPLFAGVLPVDADGRRYASYSAAVVGLDGGGAFENRGTYRLLEADLSGPGGRMAFGLGRYFDSMDVGDAYAHEYVDAAAGPLPLHSALADPCDPGRRPVNVAISTLTLRLDRGSGAATFVLHWRDPALVGHAGGLHQVLPVGVFQATAETPEHERHDFSLWRCMLREYAEELLGRPEEYGERGRLFDYDGWPFGARMTAGVDAGRIRAYCLGMGVDPLTLATDLLTVAVFDADLYDELFGRLVDSNDEGLVLSGVDGVGGGISFTAANVERFVWRERMQAAGAAVLERAWEHRDAILR